MTEKLWRVDEWRAQFAQEKDADQKRLYANMKSLVREIYVLALVRHHSMEEAIMAVYITGLYHATEVGTADTDH